MKESIQRAFDAENFRRQGKAIIDLLADALAADQQGQVPQANPWKTPDERLAFWEEQFQQGSSDIAAITAQIVEQSTRLHNNKYAGHQVGVVTPESALLGLISNYLNNGMAVYEVGQAATVIEKVVIQQLLPYFGYDERADGILTSGGTLGNLTALLTARSVKAGKDIWQYGQRGQRLALMVSEEAHYCVDRAVKIMGWGAEGIIKVPTDEQFRMQMDLLVPLYEQAVDNGQKVIAVIGSACTTSTGTFDDLVAIGAFCQKYDLWFHVDGAHGASAVFSKKFKSLVAGIERADSIVMDFHKMLLTPALTTAVFYKNSKNTYKTFHQKAHYLWSNQENEEWYNSGKRTFECTKLMMGARVYGILKLHGFQLWEDYVTQQFQLGKDFAALIDAHPKFELAIAPDCNIVCFRYLPEDATIDLSAFNAAIRQLLLEDGTYYIVQTQLQNQTYLRTTLMNPFTTLNDLNTLLSKIEQTAAHLIKLEQAVSEERAAMVDG